MARKGERVWKLMRQGVGDEGAAGDVGVGEGMGVSRGRMGGGSAFGAVICRDGEEIRWGVSGFVGPRRMKVTMGTAAMVSSERLRMWQRIWPVVLRRGCRRRSVMSAMAAPC